MPSPPVNCAEATDVDFPRCDMSWAGWPTRRYRSKCLWPNGTINIGKDLSKN